jgi:hypothetical protein
MAAAAAYPDMAPGDYPLRPVLRQADRRDGPDAVRERMKKVLIGLGFIGGLSGCAVIEAILDGISARGAQRRFAIVAPVDFGSTYAGDRTGEIAVAALTAPDRAFVFDRVRPFPDRVSEVLTLTWDESGTRLAVKFRETPGGRVRRLDIHL